MTATTDFAPWHDPDGGRLRGEALTLRAPDGAEAVILRHGAQLVSWRPAGGDERLYRSPWADLAGGRAVRGGVPVIFPQFAARGAGRRHGFARTQAWQLAQLTPGDDDAMAVFRLCDDAITRADWPHAFELELTVRLTGTTLDLELACLNSGDAPLHAHVALHSYWRLSGANGHVRLLGLEGQPFDDALQPAPSEPQVQREQVLQPGGEPIDRIYRAPNVPLVLRETPLGQSSRELWFTQQGFDDVVVWTPGAAAALDDLPAGEGARLLCIEPACVRRPIALAAGEEWVGRHTVQAR